ncbi:MAG: ATP-binding cassette domain-containing protein [Bacteroidota bacterium]|nr:ATP-binding cassette domain-containing protein [Bacteroidota bacterium]
MSIIVNNLSKHYGDVKAVDDISFEIHHGEIVGFLGPNGAGKTTTMRILTSYFASTFGNVSIEGKDIRQESLATRKMIGYLPEHNPLYPDMNVIDYLEFVAKLHGVNRSNIAKRIREMINVCGINGVKHMDIGQLSKGYRQRVGLAQAMIHDPKILIMDEPTSGLDPNQIVEIRNLIRQIGKEKTVILSTHILPEVQATCNRVLIISKGKIVADGTPAGLQSGFQGSERVFVELETPDNFTFEMIQIRLNTIPAIKQITLLDNRDGLMRIKIEVEKGIDTRKQIFQLFVANKWNLLELHREQTSLEDVFHELTLEAA